MKSIFKKSFKVTQTYNSSHKGLDMVGIGDIDVISPINGTVKSSTVIVDKSNITWEWGNYVRVDDSSGNRYFFCHLKSRSVTVGDKIKAGDKLGVMGNTGKSYGAHCHFEIRDSSNTRKNPADFLEIPNTIATYKNGWVKENGYWYYYQDNKLYKGFLKVGSKVYFLDSTGKLIITDKDGEII